MAQGFLEQIKNGTIGQGIKHLEIINEAFSISNKVQKTASVTFADILNALYAKYGTSIFGKSQVEKELQFDSKEIHAAINKLAENGYLDKPSTGKYKLSQTAIDFSSHASVADLKDAEQEVLGSDDLAGLGGEEEAKAAENTGEVAQGIRDISKLKVKKFKSVKVGNNSRYKDQMKTILSHMKSSGQGLTKTTFLLAGDVGSGKCLDGSQELLLYVSDELYEILKD